VSKKAADTQRHRPDRCGCASSESTGFDRIQPAGRRPTPLPPICSNETVHGNASSTGETPTSWSTPAQRSCRGRTHRAHSMVYAARRRTWARGVVLVIVRKDLYDRIGKGVPNFNYKVHADAKSCLNTRHFWCTVARNLPLDGIRAVGGHREAQRRQSQADLRPIDGSGVSTKARCLTRVRSHMNITFKLPTRADRSPQEATSKSMLALKGYRTWAESGPRLQCMPVEAASPGRQCAIHEGQR